MVTSGRSSSDGLAIVTLEPFADSEPHEITALDARCARMSLRWPGDRPLCCARGADIDGRARLQIVKLRSLDWSSKGPRQDDAAPSGIVERLGDVQWQDSTTQCCSALDAGISAGGVLGQGCRIRQAARAAGEREDVWLLSGCALFPLDLEGGILVPSARIPDEALVEADGGRSLWDEARARVALRFGEQITIAIDQGVAKLLTHRAQGLHLKTLK